MIDIKKLTNNDIGKYVFYNKKEEIGKIKSFNHLWVFVVYNCDNNWNNFKNYIAAATDPNDLNFIN
ncbi:MAG: hypothetical protein ACOCP8_07265 [archaeon]